MDYSDDGKDPIGENTTQDNLEIRQLDDGSDENIYMDDSDAGEDPIGKNTVENIFEFRQIDDGGDGNDYSVEDSESDAIVDYPTQRSSSLSFDQIGMSFCI